jgi:hypothetical protein
MLAQARAVQDVFKTANERLRRRRRVDRLTLLCECSSRQCLEDLQLTAEEYDELRPRGHFVLPGHADPAVERIIERRPGFDLVQKDT